jgi:hypothetical protein
MAPDPSVYMEPPVRIELTTFSLRVRYGSVLWSTLMFFYLSHPHLLGGVSCDKSLLMFAHSALCSSEIPYERPTRGSGSAARMRS